MAKRVFLIVLDSFGVGAEPDAPVTVQGLSEPAEMAAHVRR